ncbi:MAG: PAS domain S-box protein, partial [Mariprofundaceae bacterium]|nr:PAS domain S-box protein [Mariprofundaceae bacterium]
MNVESGKVRQINLSAIIEASPDAIFLADAETGLIVEANEQASGLIGRPRKEIIGMHQSDLHPKEEADRYREIFRQHRRKGAAIQGDLFVLHSDGHCVPVEITASTIEIDGGKFIYGVFRDVTERRRAEDAVRALSIRYETLLDAVPEIIMEVDASKVYRWANRAGLEFFGEDVIGREAGFYFEGEQETYTTVQPLFDGDENPIYLESWQRRSDGQNRLFAWKCKALKDANGHVTGALSTARDITEQREAEAKLLEDERRFMELFENVTDYALLLEPRESAPPIIVDANTAAFEKHGYRREEMIGQPITLLETASSAEEIGERLRLIQQGETAHFEVEHVCRDGSTFFAESACRRLENGIKGLFYSIERDITERRQAEETISQTKNKLEQFFSVVPSLICIAGVDGYFKEINHEWEKTLGYSREELLSKPFADLIHPDDLETIFREVKKQLSGQSTAAFVNRYRHKDGGYRWLEWQAAPVSESKLLYAAANDITEQKQAEVLLQQQLQESEKSRYATLYMLEDMNESRALIEQGKREWEQTFDAVTNPIFLHDDEFRIIRANRAYAGQAGIEIGEVIGKLYWEVFPKGDGPLPGCLKALKKAEEEEISTEDGRVFLSRSYTIPATEHNHHASIHVMQDITGRKQAEMNLEHLNRALTTLSTVNRTLVHAENEPELLQAICRAVVEQQGYHVAWVGYVQHDEERSIKIMASAGAGQELLEIIRPGWGKNKSGTGPCGRTVRSGKIEVVQNIAADPNYQQWADALLRCGCAADIALPLLDADGQVFGLLHVYAGEANAFTDREIALLQEMAEDLAFGVRSLRLRQHHDEIMAVNEKQLLQIHRNLQETIAAVARAVEARDPYTAGHQRRVAELAAAIARVMKLEEGRIEGIRMGATIHDIGKIHLPAEILSKPS